MADVVPENLPAAEPLESKIKGFFTLLQGKFAGQQSVIHEVNRAIQPTIEPEPASLPSLDQLLGEYAHAADWEEMPHNWGYASSGEPAGEHPEWEQDWLYLNLPPEAENGSSWTQMVIHRANVYEGKRVHTEPRTMLSYFPGKNAEAGSPPIPARMEVLHFSRWDSNLQQELTSVTQVYEERAPTASAL